MARALTIRTRAVPAVTSLIIPARRTARIRRPWLSTADSVIMVVLLWLYIIYDFRRKGITG